MRYKLLWAAAILVIAATCQSCGNSKDSEAGREEKPGNESQLKKYFHEGRLVKEITFKDGIRNGICRNYYDDGRLKRTIWYENGLKEDTAKWYYPEGKVYRASPYKNDKLHGTQLKYYKTGRIQAAIPYENGLRTPGLKEYLPDGREVENYPVIEYNLKDMTRTDDGTFKVFTQLSNKSVNVRFYRGSLQNGLFDPDKLKDITSSSGMGFTQLSPDMEKGKGYIDIIAVYSTRFRNKKIITKRISLPYNNLY